MKWIYLVERHYALLPIKIVTFGHNRKNYKKVLDINFGFDNYIYVNNHIFISEDVQNELVILLKESIDYRKTDFLLHFKKKCYETMQILNATAKTIQKKEFSKCSNRELKQLFSYFVESYQNASCFLAIFPAIGNRIEKLIAEKLKEKNILEEKVYLLTFPKKENEAAKERRELLKIATEIKKRDVRNIEKDTYVQEKIKKHIREFSWLGLRWFLGKPVNKEEIIERLKYLSTSNPEKELKEIKKRKNQLESEAKKILSVIDKETKAFVALAQEYVYLRTYRTDMINKASGRLYPFFTDIARRLGFSYQEVIYLLPEEINKGLEGKHINKKLIKERKKGFASLYINDRYSLITGSELAAFKKREGIMEKETGETELKGMVACKGKAKGIVKVVLSMDEISKVEQGDILVAVMTFPAYIPAMEKAAAFVTNEGGILCHAAIVAREMNRPCIIGTKIATQILKDGDLVEVDAEKGIVRKL